MDTKTHWNLQAFDLVYQRLKYRQTPLMPEQCQQLADILAEMVMEHDANLIQSCFVIDETYKQAPFFPSNLEIRVEKDLYLWELKKVTAFKEKYYIWIPVFTDSNPRLLCVNDTYSMLIEDWSTSTSQREINGMVFKSFEWKPRAMQAEDTALVNKLKELKQLYTSLAKKEAV